MTRTRHTAIAAALAAFFASQVALTPGTASAEGACPNEALRTGLSVHLPDCRAYEQVSPAYKDGSEVNVEALSRDGSRVLAFSHGSFSEAEGAGISADQYEIVRGPTGWAAASLNPPLAQFPFYVTKSLSADFEHSLVVADTPTEHAEREGSLYLDRTGGPVAPVGPLSPSAESETDLILLAASGDLHHALLHITTPNIGSEELRSLWPGDTTANGELQSLYEYEYTGESGRRLEPRLVGISNVGVPATVGEGHLISNCGIELGSSSTRGGSEYNAVSLSGATVFFTAVAGGGACVGSGPAVDELYARVAGAPGLPAHTVAVSEPTSADCMLCETFESEPQKRSPAVFQGASEDGSRVFFTSEQRLLPGAAGAGPFLYEYDFAGPARGKVTLLSGGDPAGPGVQGVARVSQDGSHVYYVAEGVLAGANSERSSPAEGQDNLYVRDTLTGVTAFVATLSGADEADWSARDNRPVQATPDGRFLVFQSTADLTADQDGRQEADQVFEYDADTETLVRVSRGEDAYNSDGNSSQYAATIPVQSYSIELAGRAGRSTNLALSSDGSRVFFSSEDALTPQAVNGVLSVYEYHAGHVALISDGHDPAELNGTDESGEDVFLTTAGALVGQDTDDQQDVYDAREGGGFPAPSSPVPCEGDGCQDPPGEVPSHPTAASVSVQGETPAGAPGTPAATTKPKSLTRAQKLADAVRACGKRPRRARSVCERRARRIYRRTR